MKPSHFAGLLAVGAVGWVGVLGVGAANVIRDRKDIVEVDTKDIDREEPGGEKLLALEDGGVAYLRQARLKDGGIGEVVRSVPACKRRAPGTPIGQCRRRLPDARLVDPGVNNRFSESEMVGAGCRPVACSVFAGEDPDEDEVERIKRRPKGALLLEGQPLPDRLK